MKIFILPISEEFQLKDQPFIYPNHNKDYGVEQDFLLFLKNNGYLLTNNFMEADWHYLPIYWTRWHLNHDYAKNGLEQLENQIKKVIINDSKTFTICQYDDGPVVDLKETLLFLSSRKSNDGFDIPLLSSKHKLPLIKPKKKYLASFVGRINTNEIRKKMYNILKEQKDIFIFDGDLGSSFFVKTILRSYISLSPRGYGGSSFRFFESMQLGAVPYLISGVNTLSFKKYIKWENFCLYSENERDLIEKLNYYNKEKLIEMGKKNKEFFNFNLDYQKWCKFVIKELEDLK